MYKEKNSYELTHSFRISMLSTLERIKLEAADYWGVNASRFELCYLKKEKKVKSKGYKRYFQSLLEWKDWPVDKCLETFQSNEAQFYLIKNDSKLLEQKNDDIKDTNTKIKKATEVRDETRDQIAEREKVLCMYHGLNVIYIIYL